MISHNNGIPDLGYKVPIESNSDKGVRTCWDGTSCKFDEDGTLMSCRDCPNREDRD